MKWIPLNNRLFFEGETEPCINGAILAIDAYFKQDCKVLLDYLSMNVRLGSQPKLKKPGPLAKTIFYQEIYFVQKIRVKSSIQSGIWKIANLCFLNFRRQQQLNPRVVCYSSRVKTLSQSHRLRSVEKHVNANA